MPLKRPQIGEAIKYEGYTITAHHVGPDLICCVNGDELAGFFLSTAAVETAGKRHVDALREIAAEAAQGK